MNMVVIDGCLCCLCALKAGRASTLLTTFRKCFIAGSIFSVRSFVCGLSRVQQDEAHKAAGLNFCKCEKRMVTSCYGRLGSPQPDVMRQGITSCHVPLARPCGRSWCLGHCYEKPRCFRSFRNTFFRGIPRSWELGRWALGRSLAQTSWRGDKGEGKKLEKARMGWGPFRFLKIATNICSDVLRTQLRL